MDAKTARKRLNEERQRLEGILEALQQQTAMNNQDGSSPELAVNEQHPADAGTETFELQKDMSIRRQVEAELADIERSLHRVKEGTYGTCEACGKTIAKARLLAVPAARFCVKDQTRAEREARIA